MERYFLDTNILAFILCGEYDNLTPQVLAIINNYNCQLNVSTIAVQELLQLYRLKK